MPNLHLSTFNFCAFLPSALLVEAGSLILSDHPIVIFIFIHSYVHFPPLSQVSSAQSAADSLYLQREGKIFPKYGWDVVVPELS